MPNRTLYINGRFLTQPMTGTNRFAYELSVGLAKRGYPCVVLVPNGPLREDMYDLSSLNIEKVGLLGEAFYNARLYSSIKY